MVQFNVSKIDFSALCDFFSQLEAHGLRNYCTQFQLFLYTFFLWASLFRHRTCLSDNAADCGDDRDLTFFEECPQWLVWEPWSKCEPDQEISKTRTDDKNAKYNTFKRFRERFCNTGIEKVNVTLQKFLATSKTLDVFDSKTS